MKKKLIYGIITLMLLTIVNADCTQQEINSFSECYGHTMFNDPFFTMHCYIYDYNQDLVVNLIDLSEFSTRCYISTEKTIFQTKSPFQIINS